MKRTVRRGVFETNSSSVHSITMCSGSDFDKWVSGEMIWNRWNDELIPITEENREEIENDEEHEYLTYDQFNDYEHIEYETFEDSYNTPNGETVKAFGYYGHD